MERQEERIDTLKMGMADMNAERQQFYIPIEMDCSLKMRDEDWASKGFGYGAFYGPENGDIRMVTVINNEE